MANQLESWASQNRAAESAYAASYQQYTRDYPTMSQIGDNVNSTISKVLTVGAVMGLAKAAISSPSPVASVNTPYGAASQATTVEAQAALREVQSGASVYRQGWTGTQKTLDAQNWAMQNPASTPNYANQLGMPVTTTQGEIFWMMGGKVTPNTPVITRPAPGIGGNLGGSMEAVVNPGGVGIDWFHMP